MECIVIPTCTAVYVRPHLETCAGEAEILGLLERHDIEDLKAVLTDWIYPWTQNDGDATAENPALHSQDLCRPSKVSFVGRVSRQRTRCGRRAIQLASAASADDRPQKY